MFKYIIKLINFNSIKNSRNFNKIVYESENYQSSFSNQLNGSIINDSRDFDQSDAIKEPFEKVKKKHPFNFLYPWKNLDEFVDHLAQRIVYNDKDLIAIDKPWGVAYHKANKTLYKPYSFESLSLIPGEPRFCLEDALDKLSEILEVEKLEIVKTIDRQSSGIILLSGNDKAKLKIKKSLNSSKSEAISFYNFICISQGFPTIDGDELSEKVRIKLTGDKDFKEPLIIPPKCNNLDKGYLARVKLKILSINKFNSAAYLRVSTNQLRWNFVRCYVANKAAFIVGDPRFSANVKRILGETVIETTNSFYKNNRIEPLNKEILKRLKVHSNRKVPIMLHLESIFLRNYKKQDLIVESKQLPDYFNFALKKLNLTVPLLDDKSKN